MLAIRGKAIPEHLLAEAQGVAIVPAVIKVGFIAGARRGHGVVLVRDADGEWSLPQFVTLTGGSVGWQAGVEGSDVVLVFTSQKAVRGLLQGKFTPRRRHRSRGRTGWPGSLRRDRRWSEGRSALVFAQSRPVRGRVD